MIDKVSAKIGYADAEALNAKDEAWWTELSKRCRYKAGNAIAVLVAVGVSSLKSPGK